MPLFGRKSKHHNLTERYVLGEELGTGAFSTVFKVTRIEDGNDYACKILNKKLFGDKENMVKNELRAISKISHRNVISHTEFIKDDQNYMYIVMELVTGGELFDRIIEVGSFSEKSAVHIIRQVLDACDYLHNIGIVHRDLKPENLLFKNTSESSPIMVSDFGLSAVRDEVDSIESLSTACGTPGYVSPEILLRKKYNYKVDLWSIGVITYILLCGYPPFFSRDDTKLFQQIMSAEFEFASPDWDKISQHAKDFVSLLLSKDPSQRPSAGEAMNHYWIVENENDVPLFIKEKLLQSLANLRWRKAMFAAIIAQKFKHLTRDSDDSGSEEDQ